MRERIDRDRVQPRRASTRGLPSVYRTANSAPYCRYTPEASDEALHVIDNATLEVFWRDWPQISAWAGSLWQRLDEDLAGPATPPQDPDLDEVGESG